jgi:RNase adapter protein RapZ
VNELELRARPIRVVVITGLSGSGKSTAIRALEDLGFFCIDNLPVVLLPKLMELFPSKPDEIEQVALVVDAREARFLDGAREAIDRIRAGGGRLQILFLETADAVLLRRYSETRRRHPLSPAGSVEEGIARERQLLQGMREVADWVIDTSEMTVHQLREMIQRYFERQDQGVGMNLAVVSFGFKYGLPPMADLVFDVRFLPNPYFVPELRDHPGTEPEVRDHVLSNPAAQELLGQVENFVSTFRPLYDREGKSYLTVAIGCTGGRHRSVVIAEELGKRLRHGGSVVVRHRDLEHS